MRRWLDGPDALWVFITVLAFLSVNLMLISIPAAAIEHWYLFFSPLVLAAVRFGFRGALIASSISLLNILALYFRALQEQTVSLALLAELAAAVSSPAEARDLAFRIARFNSLDPAAALARAIGGGLVVILGNLLLGLTTDRARREKEEAQRQVEQQLARYFSPQLVQAIMAGDRAVRLAPRRKEVSVLFADLRGFTRLTERLQPEELSQQLNEYLSEMTDVIFKYDGTLDKYIGDAVMAFFGDPSYHEDHAARAIQAALEMRERFLELRARWRTEGRTTLHLGIGVNTGYVTVGNVGSPVRLEYTVIGSNVNLASRLADMARPDQVLTPLRTYRIVQHLVEGRTVGTATPEGSQGPVALVEITGRRVLPRLLAEREQTLRATTTRVLTDPAFRALLMTDPVRTLPTDLFSREERELLTELALLRGTPLLGDVPVEEILTLLHCGAVTEHRAGSVLYQAIDLTAWSYLIVRGEVALLGQDEAGNEIHLATLGPGACFGEATALGDVRPTAVRAQSDLKLLVITSNRVEELRQGAPALAERLTAARQPRIPSPAGSAPE